MVFLSRQQRDRQPLENRVEQDDPYALNHSTSNLWLAALFGLAGYLLKTMGFELAPLLLAFVLSGPIRDNWQRALRLFKWGPDDIRDASSQGRVAACFGRSSRDSTHSSDKKTERPEKRRAEVAEAASRDEC